MTDRRVLRIDISTPQTAMEVFAQTWEGLERGNAFRPVASIGFESLSEMLNTLTPRRRELIQTVNHRGPTPIGDLTESVEHGGTRNGTLLGPWST